MKCKSVKYIQTHFVYIGSIRGAFINDLELPAIIFLVTRYVYGGMVTANMLFHQTDIIRFVAANCIITLPQLPEFTCWYTGKGHKETGQSSYSFLCSRLRCGRFAT